MGDIIRIREPREGNPTYINSYGPTCGNCGRDHWIVYTNVAICSGCGAKRHGEFYGYINSYGPRCGNCGRDHWFVGEKGWVCSGCGASRSRV